MSYHLTETDGLVQLADYLRLLRRRWWLIGLSVLICVLATWVVDAVKAPRYTSSTRLLVTGSVAGGPEAEAAAGQLAASRAASYANLVQTGPGVQIATEAAGVQGEFPAVTAMADGNSPFITITVEAGSPRAAQAVAAAFEEALPQIVSRLEQSSRAEVPTLTTVDPAGLPSAPTSPQPRRDMTIALAIGLVLGLASAVLRETLDLRLRDSAELERVVGASVLGLVPREAAEVPLPAHQRPRSSRSEAYRRIRANLEFSGADGLPASVAITSPGAGEGKSTLAANLAMVVAQSGRSVVLVDADLRRPALAGYFGVDLQTGLSDVLTGRVSLGQAVVSLPGLGITLVPSGPTPPLPAELVGSTTMLQVIQELEQRFDLVIVDTPPVLPVPDALQIGVNVGGIVMVARMAETSRTALKRAVEAVGKVNAQLLGVVGNASIRHEEKTYGTAYGYGYRGSREESTVAQTPAVQVTPAGRRAEAPRRAAGHGRRAIREQSGLIPPEAVPTTSLAMPPDFLVDAPGVPDRSSPEPPADSDVSVWGTPRAEIAGWEAAREAHPSSSGRYLDGGVLPAQVAGSAEVVWLDDASRDRRGSREG